MKRTAFILLLIGLAIASWIGYRMYDRPTPTAAGTSAEVTIDAPDLFRAFQEDEMAAGRSYNDKVIEVAGTVRSMDTPGNGPVNVMLESGDPLGAVVCEFDPAVAPTWEPGTAVRLKGFCAGYNLDVLLQRCAVVE